MSHEYLKKKECQCEKNVDTTIKFRVSKNATVSYCTWEQADALAEFRLQLAEFRQMVVIQS